MRLTYFAHASFLVEARDGTRVILDPYRHGAFDGAVKYDPIEEPADAVIVSHLHEDHAASDTIPGDPLVLVQPSSEAVGELRITGISTAHDEAGGAKRGDNTITVLDDGDLRLVHLGDLGHTLDQGTLDQIGAVDILLVPVGGFFTIDHEEAAAVVDSLRPMIVIPMHYKTDGVDFPVATVDPFLKTQTNVLRDVGATLEMTRATLPAERTTVVLARSR
ncbi:MAG: MBL fold metallo-hydrolase [Thermoleophilia bacterium]|nr:MBL fold metallo-hydrolase [Thermoleophilia bacterium]